MSTSDTGRIGPYELRGTLGRGGSATVYRAYDPALNREVAIKVLTTKEGQNPVLRERFRREARAIAGLRHPNIVNIYTSGEEHGMPYLVMELFPSGALSRRLGRPLALQDAAILIRQVGGALDYAHAQGFVHRDVKPANIFLDGSRAILADFGIVKALAGEVGTRLTETGMSVGTPEYTAPEQALGEHLDGRADLYALGVVLYEMLTGSPPYEGALMEVLNQHVAGKGPDPRRRNPALSSAVAAVMLKALARYPEGRYQSGAAIADALDAAIARGADTADGGTFVPPDRAARTLLIDMQREDLSGTQFGELPRLATGDQTIVMPSISQPPRSTNQGTPAVNLPPLPDLGPPPGAPARGDSTVVAGPETAGRTVVDATQLAPASSTPPPIAQQPIVQQPAPAYPPPVVQAPPIVPPGPPVQAPYPPIPSVPAPAPARSNAPLWIGLAAALVVLIAVSGIGGWLLLGRRTGATPTVPPTAVAQRTPVTATAGPVVVGSPPVPSASPSASASPTAPASAGPNVTATVAANIDPARAQIEAGDRALADGKFTDAVASYREALKVNPNSAIANRQLGLTLWVWNHEAGEIDYLHAATKLAPDDGLAWAYLSYSAVDTHQVELAYSAAQQAVHADPNLAEGYAAVANTYIRYPPDTNDPETGYQTAKQAIDQAKQLDPNSLWTLWFESQVLQTLGQYDESLVPLDKVIAMRPNWATLYYAKGGVYDAKGQIDEARTWEEKALAVDPDYANAITELGWLSYEQGDYPKAAEYFQRALSTTDDVNDYGHSGYGLTLAAQGDYTDAIAHCQRAVQIDPRVPLGYQCLGLIYLDKLQRYDDALGNYRKVIELRPLWEDGYIGVARSYSGQGNYAEGEQTLRQGLERVKTPKYINFWLGVMLYNQGNYADAEPQFEKAAQLVPDDPGVQTWLGSNLEALQRYPEARAAYERALAIDPNYQDAKTALARLQSQGH